MSEERYKTSKALNWTSRRPVGRTRMKGIEEALKRRGTTLGEQLEEKNRFTENERGGEG